MAKITHIPATLDGLHRASPFPDAPLRQPVGPVVPFPGAEQLLGPLQSLRDGFGSGVFGGLDAAFVLQHSAKLVEAVCKSGEGALRALSAVWRSGAGIQAQLAGSNATAAGSRLAGQGQQVGELTRQAAEVVRRGNAKLLEIAHAFAAKVAAAGPVLFTPPGAALLISATAEHLAQAVTVVTRTQAELSGLSGRITAAGAPVGIPAAPVVNPLDIAEKTFTAVASPLSSWATSTLTDLSRTRPQTETAGTTHVPPESVGKAGSLSAHTGAPCHCPPSPGAERPGSAPAVTVPLPAPAVPPIKSGPRRTGEMPGAQTPTATETTPHTGAGVAPPFLNGPAAQDRLHPRTVQPHRIPQADPVPEKPEDPIPPEDWTFEPEKP